MLSNKNKSKISLLLSISMISTLSLGSITVNAASKGKNPSNNTIIAGDIVMDFSPNNGFKIVNEAAAHGYTGDDLNILYVRGTGANAMYYNFTKEFGYDPKTQVGVIGTATTLPDIWSKIKYTYDGESFKKFDNIVASSDATIKPKSAFDGLIDITGNEIAIPGNTTKSIFESMVEPGKDTNATQTFKYEPEPATGAITDGTSLIVTAEDGVTTHNYTFKVTAGEGGGSIDLSVDQLKSVLKTQIAGAEALLKTMAEGQKKTDLKNAIEIVNYFYEDIADGRIDDPVKDFLPDKAKEEKYIIPPEGLPRAVTQEDITNVIGALADMIDLTFSKEFTNLTINNITSAEVNKAVYTKVNNVPADATNFNITSKDSKVEVAYNSEEQKLEVIAKTNMTAEDVTVTASADDYNSKDITFKVTTIDPSKDNFPELTVDNITDAVVGDAVYTQIKGLTTVPEGFNVILKSPTDKGLAVSYVNDKGLGVLATKELTNQSVTVTANADGYNSKDITFNVSTKNDSSTADTVKVTLKNINDNATTTVYNGSVGSVAYSIYAGLSNSQVEFNIKNVNNKNVVEVEFTLNAKKVISNNTSTDVTDYLSDLLKPLTFDKNNNQLVNTVYVDSDKKTIKLTLFVDEMSANESKKDNITLKSEYNNTSTSGTLEIEVYKFKTN